MNLKTAYIILGSVIVCSLIVGIIVSIIDRKKNGKSDEPIFLRVLGATQNINVSKISSVNSQKEEIEILDIPIIVKTVSKDDDIETLEL